MANKLPYKLPYKSNTNKTACMSKINSIDTFANLDSTQMFESVTDDDLMDAYSENLSEHKENFTDNLVQQTQACTTNFYICLVIIGIIILYMLSSDKTNYTEYNN